MEFYYHMWGHNIGSLELKTKVQGRVGPSQHTISGGQSANINDWKMARVSITSTTESQLVFEAVSGVRHLSDIAIDKVSVRILVLFLNTMKLVILQ